MVLKVMVVVSSSTTVIFVVVVGGELASTSAVDVMDVARGCPHIETCRHANSKEKKNKIYLNGGLGIIKA
ncbi:hypothetical protein YC2023_055373 [Brassica napus]